MAVKRKGNDTKDLSQLSVEQHSDEKKAVKLASCHCQKVQFEVLLVNGVIEDPRRCNCSFCKRRGAVAAKIEKENFRLLTDADALGCYQFNSLSAKHFFCKNCGIYTHHQRRIDPNILGFNVGCLDDVDVFALSDIALSDGINHPADR